MSKKEKMGALVAVTGAIILYATFSLAVSAQSYPTRVIKIIVTTGAGASTSDLVIRWFAERMTKELGQSVIVDNRPGEGGILGTALGANAKPDGYTLVQGQNGALTMSPNIVSNLPYDPKTAFAPIAMMSEAPFMLAVPSSTSPKSVKELIERAKANPDKLLYASTGIGSSAHLAAELFASMANVKLVHVPYSGNAAAMPDLLGGRLDMFFTGVGALVPFVKSGRLRALAMGTLERSNLFPDLPTLNESGLAGYDVSTWVGVLAPAHTPPAIIDRLSKEIEKIGNLTDTQQFYANNGLVKRFIGPAEFGPFMDSERKRWGDLIKSMGGLK